MVSLDELKALVADILQIGGRLDSLEPDAALMGGVPEFDSMAVVSLLGAIEENYGLLVEDDELDGEIFETLGNLLEFVNGKLA